MTVNSLSLEGEVRTALETLRSMPVQLGELIERSRIETIQVGLDQSLSLAGKNEKYNQSAAKFMAQVDRMEQQAQLYKETLERWIAAKFGKPQGDPAAELLHEIRLDKAWRRLVKIFDSVQERGALIRTLTDVISEAVKNDDRTVLDALDEELPAYFQARNMTIPPTLTEQIRAARIAHANPEERQALALREELETGFPRLAAAFGEVKRAIQNKATVAILPGWDSTERITLDLPSEPATPSWG
jgi:hypothetical protein